MNFCKADNDGTHVSTISPASSATACEPRSEHRHFGLPQITQASSHALPSNTQPRFFSDLNLPSRGPELQRLQTQSPGLTKSASSTIQSHELLNQILPPKRELPFVKPAAKKPRNSTQRTPRKPTTFSLPSSARSETSGLQRSVPICSQEAKTVQPDGDHNITNESRVLHPPRPQENNALPHPFEHLPPSGQPSLPNSNPPNPKSLNIEQALLPATSPINAQERSVPTPVAANNNNAPSPTHPQVSQPSNPPPLPENRNAGTITSSDLSSYLQTPTPERSALIESWICQQLQDDGFLTLCEDMEGVWRRIAFGR